MGKKQRKPPTAEQVRIAEQQAASARHLKDRVDILAPQLETQVKRLISAPVSSPLMRTDSTLGMATRERMMSELQGELRLSQRVGVSAGKKYTPLSTALSPGDPLAASGLITGSQARTTLHGSERPRLDRHNRRYPPEEGSPEALRQERERIVARYGTGGGMARLRLTEARTAFLADPGHMTSASRRRLMEARLEVAKHSAGGRRGDKTLTPAEARKAWGSVLGEETTRMVTRRKAGRRKVAAAGRLGPATALGF